MTQINLASIANALRCTAHDLVAEDQKIEHSRHFISGRLETFADLIELHERGSKPVFEQRPDFGGQPEDTEIPSLGVRE